MRVGRSGRPRFALGTAAAAALLAGGQSCDIVFPAGPCLELVEPGIAVEVYDAGTWSWIPDTVTLTAVAVDTKTGERHGFYRLSTVHLPQYVVAFALLEGAHGGIGTFDVEVSGDGYETWRRSGIKVKESSCRQPRTVHVTAVLRPSKPAGS